MNRRAGRIVGLITAIIAAMLLLIFRHCLAIRQNCDRLDLDHTIGSAEHPMIPEHYIQWIALATRQGNQRKELEAGQKPQAEFMLCEGDEVEAAYAYCNLHGLWKAEP